MLNPFRHEKLLPQPRHKQGTQWNKQEHNGREVKFVFWFGLWCQRISWDNSMTTKELCLAILKLLFVFGLKKLCHLQIDKAFMFTVVFKLARQSFIMWPCEEVYVPNLYVYVSYFDYWRPIVPLPGLKRRQYWLLYLNINPKMSWIRQTASPSLHSLWCRRE